MFIAKYDKDGNLRWFRSIGGTNYDKGIDIAVDDRGFVYLLAILTWEFLF